MKKICMYIYLVVAVNCVTSQSAGGDCTVNSIAGNCIPVLSCPDVAAMFNTRPVKPEVVKLLRMLHCGFEGNTPLICCTTNQALNTTTLVITTPSSVGSDNRPPNPFLPTNCGKIPATTKIRSIKRQVQLGEFPYLALLGYKSRNGNFSFNCGGVVISKRYVITAAHCVDEESAIKLGNLDSVRLGEHDLNSNQDCENKNDCSNPVQNIKVAEKIVHPQYSRINRQHDIAMLRLATNMQFNDDVQPICIPSDTVTYETNQWFGVAGWGKDDDGVKSSIKQFQRVAAYNQENCFNLAVWPQSAIKTTQICAGGTVAYDVCAGNDGGPLMVLYGSPDATTPTDFVFMLVGVLSIENCNKNNLPGVFTNVGSYADWILTNMVM